MEHCWNITHVHFHFQYLYLKKLTLDVIASSSELIGIFTHNILQLIISRNCQDVFGGLWASVFNIWVWLCHIKNWHFTSSQFPTLLLRLAFDPEHSYIVLDILFLDFLYTFLHFSDTSSFVCINLEKD